MKIVTLTTAAAILFSAAMPAQAQNGCEELSELAEATMRLRQQGVPMSKLLEDIPDVIKKIVTDMTIDAYATPRYTTPEIVERQITEFGNRYMVVCLRGGE